MAYLTVFGQFPFNYILFSPGHDASSSYSFSGSETSAVWTVNGEKLTVTGTDLDTDHGTITSIASSIRVRYDDNRAYTNTSNLSGISVDFNSFRNGINDGDWDKIGAALQGIDLRGSPDFANHAVATFQGLGGDDDITAAARFMRLYFDGGNDLVILRNNADVVYAASLNYQPEYKTLRWEVDARGGDDALWLWSYDDDPNIFNVATKGFNITLGKESSFLDGTALFKSFTFVYGSPFGDGITGDTSDNKIYGRDGGDKLYGAVGNDLLDGGTGNDVLSGGKGHDDLYGGTGGDRFLFENPASSKVAAAQRDTIYDFSHAEHDEIDLHLIDANGRKQGNQAFDFIGKQGFHHTAGEVRYVHQDGNTFVYGDRNGDGKADFALEVEGKITLVEGDFHL